MDKNHNQKSKTYVEIIDFSGPPSGSGRIHVQIAVWADKEMTELVTVTDCYSVGSMNRTLDALMEANR